MNPAMKSVFLIVVLILLSITITAIADYYDQNFTSYYIGQKLTTENDSMRFHFTIPDSGAVLAGFVLSSDTDWQECDNESAVLDICVDQNDSSRQVVITYMGRKKYEYTRYLWELNGGKHYIDIIFNPAKSAPNAQFVRIDSIKIALVPPGNPYFYPCLLIPYLNTYKIYSKDDIPLIVYYAEPGESATRRYYNIAIFSHDTGHLGQPGSNQDYGQFMSDRASSLDVEWMWDVTIDLSDDSIKFVEKYYQGSSHSRNNYFRDMWNYHPTIKVSTSNNNFSYGFGLREEKNRYPQLIPPLISSDYHSFYDSHSEILEIWVKELRRDYGMYNFDCRHKEAPVVFPTGYHHDPDEFEFTDPVYHLFFNYIVSNNTGRNLGIYVKVADDEKWYGRKVSAGNGQHWQSVVMPDFIDLNQIDSLKIESSGNAGTEIKIDLSKIYFFDQDVNHISHNIEFPENQLFQDSESVKKYLFQELFSDQLTLHGLNIVKIADSVYFELPVSGDVNKNGIAEFYIKEVDTKEYIQLSMERRGSAFSLSLSLSDYPAVYDIMVQAHDEDGVSGYIPQYIEEIDFSTLTSVDLFQEQAHSFSLKNNYPNPFNASTLFEFEVQSQAFVKIDIYNIRGQLVKHLVAGNFPAGSHRVRWHGTDNFGIHVGSGVYLVNMNVGRETISNKIVMLK